MLLLFLLLRQVYLMIQTPIKYVPMHTNYKYVRVYKREIVFNTTIKSIEQPE